MEGKLSLRKAVLADLETFFVFQLDEEANHMAAFTAKDPTDRDAYMTKWTKLLEDGIVIDYAILYDGKIAGSIGSYEMHGEAQVTYWLGREYWGKGIATRALMEFLKVMDRRPLYGRAVADNTGSRRVLEKCGFVKVADDRGFANARNMEVDEFVFKLDR